MKRPLVMVLQPRNILTLPLICFFLLADQDAVLGHTVLKSSSSDSAVNCRLPIPPDECGVAHSGSLSATQDVTKIYIPEMTGPSGTTSDALACLLSSEIGQPTLETSWL